MASDNKLLGEFDLIGIPPAPRGTPQIEVTFDIDANGIVNVGAKDKATGKEQNIVIQSSGGLSESDIQRMMAEAEKNAESDKMKKELIEAKNEGDHAVYNAEKGLADHGDKLEEGVKDSIKESISALKKSLEGESLEEIKEKTSAMMKASMKIGEAMYAKSKDNNNNKESEGKDENVMDAEFKEKDDKAKSA